MDLTGTSYNSSESTLKDLRDLSLSEPTMDEDITAATVTMAQQSQSLQQEFSLLNRDIPNISVDQVGHRHCKLTSGICLCDVIVDSRGWNIETHARKPAGDAEAEWEAETGICQWSTSTFGSSSGCVALEMLE